MPNRRDDEPQMKRNRFDAAADSFEVGVWLFGSINEHARIVVINV
jgi:hypothetical protein